MQRIAVPMIGGMVSSTVLTLVVIPVVYAMVKGCDCRHGHAPLMQMPKPHRQPITRPRLSALEGDEDLIVLRPHAHGHGKGDLLDHGEIADRILQSE